MAQYFNLRNNFFTIFLLFNCIILHACHILNNCLLLLIFDGGRIVHHHLLTITNLKEHRFGVRRQLVILRCDGRGSICRFNVHWV
jgi:hypothetical protein